MNDEPQIRTRSAAERECVQLRAEVERLREIHHGDPHMLGAVLGYELREAEEAGEVVQLRAERDQALALLRQVRATMEPVTEDAIQFLPEEDGKRYTFAAGFNSAAFAVRQHIDQSGLLDDEGQQR